MATPEQPYLPSPGDLVFVKVKGHPVWPARIQARAGEKFEVYFYGTAEQATLKSKAIWPYNEENKAQFCNPAAMKRKGYVKGLEEIEKTPEMAAVVSDDNENLPLVIKKPIKKLVQQPSGNSDIVEVSQTEVEEVIILDNEDNTGLAASKSEVPSHAFSESFSVGRKVFAKWVDWKAVSFYPAEVVHRVNEQIVKVKFLEGDIEMEMCQESDVISALQLQPGSVVMVNHKQLEAYKITATLLHQPTEDEAHNLTFQYTDQFSGEPKTANHSEVSLTNLQASTVLRGRGLVPTANKVSAHIDYENLVFGKRKATGKEASLSNTKMEGSVDAGSNAASRCRSRGRQNKTKKMRDELVMAEQDDSNMKASDICALECLGEMKVVDDMNNFQDEAKKDESDVKVMVKEASLSDTKMENNLDACSIATPRSKSKGRQIKSKKIRDELAMADQDAVKMEKEASDSCASKSLGEVKAVDDINNLQEEAKNDECNVKSEVWVKVKATGELVKINVDQDKPTEWLNNQQVLEWDLATARNVLRLQKQVDSGVFLPEEVVRALEQKVQLSPEEEEILRHQATLTKRRKKVAWLRTEQEMVDIDIGIKTSLSRSAPQLSLCLEHLSSLLLLPLQPLMLLKRPELVDTLTKLKSYGGPVDLADFNPAEKGNIMKEVRKIKKLSVTVMNIVWNLFPDITPEGGDSFLESFKVEVDRLRERTSDWPEDKVLFMTELPGWEEGAQAGEGKG